MKRKEREKGATLAKTREPRQTGKQDTNVLCQAGIGVRTVRGRGG